MLDKKIINTDLCVIGGGMAGIAAAISAAREGIKVVLMHERAVLGGNASSEIRMWICGSQGKNNRETGIIEEIALENLYRNPTKSYAVWDTVLYDFVKREKNITLLLNCSCMDAETEEGTFKYGRTKKITSVTGWQMTTQCFYEVKAKFFCDSSGDSILAPLTGAEFKIGREGKNEFSEDTEREEADNFTMGMSCLIQGRETDKKIEYKAPECATPLTEENFNHRNLNIKSDYENYWYLELGGDKNTISDTEVLRDELIGLAAGTWDYIKNSGKFDSETWELDFLGFLPGKRESRRMVGEVMISQRDVSDGVIFHDEIAYGGWPLDDHFPGGFYHKGAPNTNRMTPAPYSIPYRALYSKNVENLFFAGRNISMTHMAMSSIRVMATCALLGEAVGKAASLAVRNSLTPQGVYLEKLGELQTLLQNEDAFLPHIRRKISPLCKNAALSGDETLRNGEDRIHKLYGEKTPYFVEKGKDISYQFKESKVSEIHIVFDSDLDRCTLPGSECERIHSTRANTRLDSPVMHMPKTLCREFKLIGELNGEKTELLHVTDNRKRCYHITQDSTFDCLTLVPIDIWDTDAEEIPVISFDFK